ncbi:class I SAM-dependent methyltransferase [Methylophaga sp.]|uniref:class I SAM-dependent methyltransferase n=1 Tax=Methylophaga sp. TaxID=2024840 RepID=UPI003F6A0BE8
MATSLPTLTDIVESVSADSDAALLLAKQVAAQLSLPLREKSLNTAQIQVSTDLVSLHIPELGNPVNIDFATGKYDHRRKFGGGRGQPLARAVGLKKGQTPTIIDATAGFARDAFVLASLGCDVSMLEQSGIMSLLIYQAINRGNENDVISEITKRLSITHCNAIDYLNELTSMPDVIYLDPMYPSRDKSALVKKEMQLLHQLIGPDLDSEELLSIARKKALKRVVVKRPKGADYVGMQKPSVSITSKNTRYDIYPTF